MAKYIENPSVRRLDSGKRYYTTAVPETPRLPASPTTYTARRGDRWDLLAYRFYGRAALWYRIALANASVDGSMFIKEGPVVKIPMR